MNTNPNTYTYWAQWDFTKKPYYTLWKLMQSQGDYFVFEEKRGARKIAMNSEQIRQGWLVYGTFRPFVLCTEGT